MKKNIIKLLTFFFIFLTLNAFSQVTVTQNDFQASGWDIFERPGFEMNSGASFVCGPLTPPRGQGSLELTIENKDGRVLFRNDRHNGTFLKDITELTYWTYITSNQSNNAPYLAIQIDKDGIADVINGYENLVIVYVPKFQASPVVSLNLWQEWNALIGDWILFIPKTKQYWDPQKNEPITDETTLKDHVFPLAWYIKDGLNNPMIINTDLAVKGGGPGIRFGAGLGGELGSAEWVGFNGNIDLFKIKKPGQETIYDFEENTVCPYPRRRLKLVERPEFWIITSIVIVVIWGCFRFFRNMRNRRTENIKH